jgi:hypothetical protein
MDVRKSRVVWATIAAFVMLLSVPAAAQNGCTPFKVPPAPEWGDFITNIWYSNGDVFIAGEKFDLNLTIWSVDFRMVGKKGNTSQGVEKALYDFGAAGTFQTEIRYVIQHNNDPSKWYMTATETIIPDSGTGRFKGVTGHFADQGSFWLTDPERLEASGLFVTHGAICGVAPAE